MRVVAGSARGRRIQAPPGTDTRPTTDRVREAVFNALGSLGVVREALVADLFAGSGALGIEALSRGAAHVHFVESDARAVDVIGQNLENLALDGRATIHRVRVEQALSPDGPLPAALDLVLADPPYDFDAWPDLLDRLGPRLASDAVVVVESDRAVALPEGWEKLREKSYSGTVVLFASPPDRPGHDAGEPDPTGADA